MPTTGILGEKGANIGNLFFTAPKVPQLQKVIFGFNKNYWAKKVPEGAHTLARRVGGARLLGAPPVSWAPWWPSGAHLLLYEVFYPGKKSQASLRDETLPPHGGTLAEPI